MGPFKISFFVIHTIIMLGIISSVFGHILLSGYSGRNVIHPNKNATVNETIVNATCRASTAGKNLTSEEEDCILKCTLEAMGIFMYDKGVRQLHDPRLLNFFHMNTNIIEVKPDLSQRLVTLYKECNRVSKLWEAAANAKGPKSDCIFYRYFTACIRVNSIGLHVHVDRYSK